MKIEDFVKNSIGMSFKKKYTIYTGNDHDVIIDNVQIAVYFKENEPYISLFDAEKKEIPNADIILRRLFDFKYYVEETYL